MNVELERCPVRQDSHRCDLFSASIRREILAALQRPLRSFHWPLLHLEWLSMSGGGEILVVIVR